MTIKIRNSAKMILSLTVKRILTAQSLKTKLVLDPVQNVFVAQSAGKTTSL